MGAMKLLAKNKRGSYDYEITEKLVAGIVLSGAEVKSTKAGHISLKGSFIQVHENEAYLTNAHITPYNNAGNKSQLDPTRSRKLLLHKKQIIELMNHKNEGLTAIPLAVLQDKALIKVEIGVGRGKKQFDKREIIKKRDTDREARRLAKG
jgi:SsrA-binding protein